MRLVINYGPVYSLSSMNAMYKNHPSIKTSFAVP